MQEFVCVGGGEILCYNPSDYGGDRGEIAHSRAVTSLVYEIVRRVSRFDYD